MRLFCLTVVALVPGCEAGCVASDSTICVSIDIFASETGYYRFQNYSDPLPEINVTLGATVRFDQSDISNWMHPIGFAYYPDGAHGAYWGGEEREEVEDADALLYLIDDKPTTCPDAGDTGLDCYGTS